nr:IPT/TIG domain-containing protein [Kineococcus siccus]
MASPAAVDLRTTGFLPPVGDQGPIGSCATWTLAYTMMGYYAAKDRDSGAPYAPLYLYDLKVVGAAPTGGTVPEWNLAELQSGGVDTQDDFPQGYYDYRTAVTPAQKANAAKFKVTGWKRLWAGAGQGVAARTLVTAALAGGHPVAVGLPVYPSFVGIRDGNVHTPTGGTSQGGHMVTIIGYDDQGVTIRNQWGTGWGAKGDARLSWAFVQQHVQAAYTITGVTSPADAGTPYAPTPALTRLSVASGPATGGTAVTVTGSNLAAVTAVTVGGVPARFALTAVAGANQLLVTTPARGAGPAQVRLVAPGGTSAATTASVFTYAAAVPAVTRLSATTVSTAGGETVTVTGTGLGEVTRVTAGGVVAATLTRTSPTSLSFPVPARAPGTGDVVLTSPAGSSAPVAAGRLTWVAPPAPTPVLTGAGVATVPAGRTSVVTFTGRDLTGTTGLTVGGTPATGVTVLSPTQVRATVPARAAGTHAVVVTTSHRTVSAPLALTYRR